MLSDIWLWVALLGGCDQITLTKSFTPLIANGTLVSHSLLPPANAQTHSIMVSRLTHANILAIHLGTSILSGGRFTCTFYHN